MIKITFPQLIFTLVIGFLLYPYWDDIRRKIGTPEAKQAITNEELVPVGETEVPEELVSNNAVEDSPKKKYRTTRSATRDETLAYIKKWRETAVLEMELYGVPASISLAQGLKESNSGFSDLAARHNNHFGIKCFSRNCRQGHCTNKTDDTHKDFFLRFTTPAESWRFHSKLVTQGNYQWLKRYASNDYVSWANGLARSGYATQKGYGSDLIALIEKYELYKFDKAKTVKVPLEIATPVKIAPAKVKAKPLITQKANKWKPAKIQSNRTERFAPSPSRHGPMKGEMIYGI